MTRTVKIVSDGTLQGATISLDGVDISTSVRGIYMIMDLNDIARIHLDILGKLDIELPAEVTVTEVDDGLAI